MSIWRLDWRLSRSLWRGDRVDREVGGHARQEAFVLNGVAFCDGHRGDSWLRRLMQSGSLYSGALSSIIVATTLL